MPTILLALLFAVAGATANAAGFALRSYDLERRWQAAEAAGVPAASLAEARRELSAEQARRAGPVPYALVSGAAFADPFATPEASADAAYGSALARARERAAAALARRRAAAAPNDDGQADRAAQLATVARPVDADALARRWDTETAHLAAARQQLAGQAGGLAQGLPADVIARVAALSDAVSRAELAEIGTESADAALVDATLYLTEPYPALLAGHQAILDRLRTELDHLAARLDLRARAESLLAQDAGLLEKVTQFGAGDQFKGRLDQARAGFVAARAARDEAGMDAAVAGIQRLDADLQAAAGGRLPTSGIACETGAPAQLIIIHLATQQLVAYENGCPILRTPVTTGRAALPTGRGTFHIYYKAARYHMISPWPLGSPFYYPPTWVSYAMEFISNGTFIHSADWQPDDSYGQGSEYGPYASHGCVHVIDGPLQQLYDWAAIGATVVVGD